MPRVGARTGLEPCDETNGEQTSDNHAGLIRLVEILALQAAREAMRGDTRPMVLT
jgi:hypothetical protein